jgi:phosphotriesterase-related protein
MLGRELAASLRGIIDVACVPFTMNTVVQIEQLYEGHARQVLMSHDIAYKHLLTKWGGCGYHHLLVNVVPRLRRKGLDDPGIRGLLVDNRAAPVFA